MAMTLQIESAIRGFNEIILGGVPILLRQNETAFLSFMCSVAAIDALAGYRYTTDKERFQNFIKEYFPAAYASHAEKLYLLRCRLLHNFSPAYFTLAHADPAAHLAKSKKNDTVLSDDIFFADLKAAAKKFFDEVQSDIGRQDGNKKRGQATFLVASSASHASASWIPNPVWPQCLLASLPFRMAVAG